MSNFRQIHSQFTASLDAGRIDDAVASMETAVRDVLASGSPRAGVSLVCSALEPLVAAGHATTGLGWIDIAFDALEPVGDDPTSHSMEAVGDRRLRGRLLVARAGVLRTLRRYSEALEDQSEAIELLEGSLTDAQLATLRHDRAVLLAELGHLDEAVGGLVAAREAFLGLRDRVGVAASDHNLGFVLHDLGALDDAIEYLTEARDIFLATGMGEEAAACDQNLGVVFYDAGRLADAGRRFAVAHQRFVAHDAQVSAAECNANLSTLLVAMGKGDEADRYRRRAEAAGVGIPTAPGTSSQIPAVTAAEGPITAQPVSRSGSASA